jgi:hypothetical protein
MMKKPVLWILFLVCIASIAIAQDPNAEKKPKQGVQGGGGGPSIDTMASHNARSVTK